MIRAVLAVSLSAALVAAVAPAIEDARAARTERLVERDLDRIERAAASLVHEDEPGARRTLTVSLPSESPTAAGVEFVAIGGLPADRVGADSADSNVLAYRITDGRRHVSRISTDVRTVGPEADHDDGAPLVLSGGETYRLVLRLDRREGASTVRVTARRFKSEDGTTPTHAGPPGTLRRDGPRLRL